MTQQPAAVVDPGHMGRPRRKVRNYLLQPLLQIKLGLYSILIAILFAGILSLTLYFKLAQFAEIVFELTDVEEEVSNMLTVYLTETSSIIALIMFGFLLASISLAIVYTHKLVGPTVAFRRHIQRLMSGQYDAKTVLRKGDAFSDLADDLNRLSEVLSERYGPRP